MKNLLPFILMLAVGYAIPAAAQHQKPVLNHIAIYVKDLKISTDFYMKVVNLDTIPEPFHDGRHTWFSVSENSHLHLIQGAAAVTEHDKNSHLCFSVPSIEDVIATLKKNNIEYESWLGKKSDVTVRVDGVRQIYFKDPDGFWIEINNDYPKSTAK
jgi:lactoylglutathione lyase